MGRNSRNQEVNSIMMNLTKIIWICIYGDLLNQFLAEDRQNDWYLFVRYGVTSVAIWLSFQRLDIGDKSWLDFKENKNYPPSACIPLQYLHKCEMTLRNRYHYQTSLCPQRWHCSVLVVTVTRWCWSSRGQSVCVKGMDWRKKHEENPRVGEEEFSDNIVTSHIMSISNS